VKKKNAYMDKFFMIWNLACWKNFINL